jgi:hypothetical protein
LSTCYQPPEVTPPQENVEQQEQQEQKPVVAVEEK